MTMAFVFGKHYTVEEARALLPKVRLWLERLDALRQVLIELDERLSDLGKQGDDLGGELVNRYIRSVADVKSVLNEFQSRQIQLKDIHRGLIDFPALRDGKEVFLCWERDEDDIEFWHDLETGYPGREPL
jgi:hypothetical protein